MSTHNLAHLAIFGGYLIAMYLVPVSLARLVRISRATVIFGSGFFLFCGLTHLGLVLADSDALWVNVTDHIQAVCIWGFAISLVRDLNRAARRLADAMALTAGGDAAGALDVLRDVAGKRPLAP